MIFSTSTVSCTPHTDSSPASQTTEFQVPVDSPEPPIPITVHFSDPPPSTSAAAAAARIQAAYRSYAIRTLVKKIAAVKSETDRLERMIQQQETVDAVRSEERERLRINELLMRLLLDLDSVPGFDPPVRDLRRRLSRRIVGLQEVMDGICDHRVGSDLVWEWDEVIGSMEEDLCRENGGDELDRFCAQNLGFRCFQRFLRDH
ncbi:hypothetical protein Dimus_035063 [Dionaea muscipula]